MLPRTASILPGGNFGRHFLFQEWHPHFFVLEGSSLYYTGQTTGESKDETEYDFGEAGPNDTDMADETNLVQTFASISKLHCSNCPLATVILPVVGPGGC